MDLFASYEHMKKTFELFHQALNEGLAYSQHHWPDASRARHAAYANVYAYARTGLAGGIGGPSLRELYACTLAQPPHEPDEAREIARHVHDPLTVEQLKVLSLQFGKTFDDDPEDISRMIHDRS